MTLARCLKITVIGVFVIPLVLQTSAIAHDSTGYVPWGIDEFEFFGLKKNELTKHFGSKLTFTKEFALARMCNKSNKCSSGPQFELTYTKDGQIATVQRLFIDGAGCQLRGPILDSKREALDFSIRGLEKLGHRDKNDETKLVTARQLLSSLNSAAKKQNNN